VETDVHAARFFHNRLRPLIAALELESDPVSVKHALHLLRGTSPTLRLPLVPIEPKTASAITAALAAVANEPLELAPMPAQAAPRPRKFKDFVAWFDPGDDRGSLTDLAARVSF